MTGGGFYVVSFVSCSSCFMLKFQAIMSLNSLESEGLGGSPFLSFCTLDQDKR